VKAYVSLPRSDLGASGERGRFQLVHGDADDGAWRAAALRMVMTAGLWSAVSCAFRAMLSRSAAAAGWPMWSREAGGFQDRAGHDAVADRVRMLVGAAGRRSALPGPLADQRHVAGQGADPWDRHRIAEIGGVERSEHVDDTGASLDLLASRGDH
jgi:hypothetical protein